MSTNHERPLKPAADKTPSEKVAAWLCGECGAHRRTRDEADACCVCKRCRKNVLQKVHGSRESECEACTIKDAIRYAQVSIRRETRSLRSSEEHLAKLLERKAKLLRETDG